MISKITPAIFYHSNLNGGTGSCHVYISSGGIANYNTVISRAHLHVGGTANNNTVNSSGYLEVSSGGTANRTTVNRGGYLYVSSGGTLTGRIIPLGGVISAFDGAIVDFDLTETAPGTGAIIHDLTGITGTPNWIITVNADQAEGIYTLADGATGFDGTITVVNRSGDELGKLTVGGTTVISGVTYSLSLSDGNLLTLKIGEEVPPSPYTMDRLVLSSQTISVNSGEVIHDTLVCLDGKLLVNDGGTALETLVASNGFLIVSKGGTTDTTVLSGGNMVVSSNGSANATTVNQYGIMIVSSGGIANSTTANDEGCLHVYSGGTANNTTVNNSGGLIIYKGGTADNATAGAGGALTVSSGGTLNSVTVGSGGSLSVFKGGMLTGSMFFDDEATVFASPGTILDFNLTRTAAGAATLVNGLFAVQGTPIYTLTIDGTESSGTYRLADGVSVFTGVIAVMNTSGEQLGNLMVGQKLETEYADYTLKVTNGCLTVTVDKGTPPAADTVAPTAPAGLMPVVDGQNVALLWNESTDDISGVREYIVNYSLNGEIFTVRTTIPHYVMRDADYGTWSWSVQAVDFAGNESAVTVGDAFTVTSFKPYTVEYSTDNFEHAIRFTVTTPTLNAFRMSGGTYQMRVMATDSVEWMEGAPIVAPESDMEPQLIKSDADGNADVFFANSIGTWESGYLAQHVGSINDWSGTNEYATVFGKNKLADIIEGSTDANILLMTDDENGDALFVDDIYTDLPGSIEEQQSRIAQIDEIRAGAGNDIVDMTSQRFEYVGDGLTIRGGEGNDTIWANKGDNFLFGDAGNDRIVGASGNDVIAGGIGNDRLHGGGGEDIFSFCDNWGVDNVEQLTGGSVTLWFASGSEANWDPETLTYTDGDNSVKVSGVTADKIMLKFGDDGSAQFASLANMGAFFDATSERIFEESGKGMLASL